MKKKSIYLCGPITGASDAEVYVWRKHIKEFCPDYECLDPTRHEMPGDGVQAPAMVEAVIMQDIADIRACDVLVRHCFRGSDGSAMEQFAAHLMGKVIVCIIPPDVLTSPWTRHFCTAVVASEAEAVAYINSLPRF